MVRAYLQQARAAAAANKRQEVLDAAIAMLAEQPLPHVTLDAVSKQAGAARSTVYVMFGSRAGLLEAVAVRLLERIEFERLVAAVELPDPRQALDRALDESARLYGRERDVARALWSWADLDPAAAAAFAVLDGGREAGTNHLARRLADGGLLRADVSQQEAEDVLFLLTSFDTFDQLYTGRHLDVTAIGTRLRVVVERTLLRDDIK
ncbi:MAG TPA: helix-turn-helix domain-containing protein [Ilumatobacteraceae bacterium]